MTKVQRQHCREIGLDATSWRFWLKRCSCCFETLTRLRDSLSAPSVKNTPDISAENNFTVRLWERHHVTSSQVMPLTAATDGWEFECWQWSTASWTVGNRKSVVRSLVKNFKVSSSASRFPAEKHAAGSVFTSMTTTTFKPFEHKQTCEGKTRCSGANKCSVQTQRHSCSDTFVPFTGHTKHLKQPAVFTSWTAALLQCETSRCSFIPAFFWLAATLKTSWALVSQYTESEL